ncbi:cell division protein FtsL [Lactobacillus hamsteri]|uniref:Cell division protein FtsL n=1 Tax=Lactobacillus hamsteri DSM 5661 = JCM 6256 TaxID=1423754 RepID=A0A0R1YBX9_9LACO|nr:cell division protein FtsL [Lactobacillus hamsteri]KRM37225.1 cell division protein FtsL [Lactobacillus hamsteri DSM 5661 = JCM 6256]
MADSSARRIEFEPNKQVEVGRKRRIAPNPRQVRWTGLERTLVILGSIITLGMMTFLVSSSISATSAQHQLSNVQQEITKIENSNIDLRQQIGELSSSARLNKIARAKGLTLIEKNIRTIR